MKTLISFICLIFLFSSLVGCGDEKLKKVEQLKEFRVLGVLASAPEVAPGGSSTLRLIVSDPNGGGRTLTGQVRLCIDPGIARGAFVSCDHDTSAVSTTYTIDTVNDVDLGAANLYTGQATATVTANVPATIHAGRSERDKFNGVGYIAIFTFDDNGRSVSVFKRVLATNRAALNTNPTFSAINHNGAAITAKPALNDPLSVTTSGAESYQLQNIDGSIETLTEEYEVAWYITSGELSNSKALATETIRYKSDPPATSLGMLVLVRDERGGLAFRREILP
jgi:hypothetical protein